MGAGTKVGANRSVVHVLGILLAPSGIASAQAAACEARLDTVELLEVG